MKRPFYAVLTGDIVGSSGLNGQMRRELTKVLKNILAGFAGKREFYEIYRGDGFQLLCPEPKDALVWAIQIRAALKSGLVHKRKPLVDARISIGIGTISYHGDKVTESDGEAFRLSGRSLDDIKNSNLYLLINTQDQELNRTFRVVCLLLDSLIQKWSAQQAEVISGMLSGIKQQGLAEKLGISQPSVNQRLQAAEWRIVNEVVAYYKEMTKKYN